jgi:hypothetical protein
VQEDEEATTREEGEKQSVELVIQCGRYVHFFNEYRVKLEQRCVCVSMSATESSVTLIPY